MSRKLCINFEIRSTLIMKDTLKQMGIDYNELNADELEVRRNYSPIHMNARTGQINFDSDDTHMVDELKQNYMVNFYKDQAIREGMQLREERQANGEIHLTLLH
jgi:hypothetical protein